RSAPGWLARLPGGRPLWVASAVRRTVGVAGLTLIGCGLRGMIRALLEAAVPGRVESLADVGYNSQHLRKGPKVVVVGGGTGLSTMLRGLKEWTSNITAIVTMADDGGSS